ncbi:Phosphatidylinositol 3,4,5-trisphosphate-dependent Rac exchanger 2 protein [Entomortierella beljakovae]|nr:Phosphatidylinositol 3,4,5-trisphosphate-dependent Rac exchanger 2 protein [Entomortierella beljakovae]
MDNWRATHSQSHSQPVHIQPSKNAPSLAPVVVLDAIPVSPNHTSADRGISTPGLDLESSLFSPTLVSENFSAEQLPPNITDQQQIGLENLNSEIPLGRPIQLCVSINIDPEQHQSKLLKSRVDVVLVLTALVQLPCRREIWVEQSRTELMSLEKGRMEGHFVRTLQFQIQDNFLVIGFTLLVVPPPNTSPKLIAAFPALDGLLPWAETSVAVEHFALSSSGSNQEHIRTSNSPANSFSVPLMDVQLPLDTEQRRSKYTVATLKVVVEEVLPRIPIQKENMETQRIGPSFSQTYHGRTLRGTIVYGREHLYESPLAFSLPLKLLQILAEDERRVLEELEKEPEILLSDMIQALPLDHKPNPIMRGNSFMDTLRRGTVRRGKSLDSTRARQIGLTEEDSQLQKLLRQQISAHRNIEVYYQDMAIKLEQKQKENMEVGQGPFRRSPEKKEESLQWVPVNCCVQDFLVYDDGHQINYQTTTVGAAAAHSAGFARWHNSASLGTIPPLGAYWSKRERGSDLLRDFKALQDVLTTCSNDISSIISSTNNINNSRILPLVKEVQFLSNEIISFGEIFLSDFLTKLSTEGSASFICGEISCILERLNQLEISTDENSDQIQAQEPSADWMAHCKRTIREIVTCTQDMGNFIAIAIQHECLATDAALVATSEWVVAKKSRECCLSQITAALATSFMALLEDWWTNMSEAINSQKDIEHKVGDHHLPECKQNRPREMPLIDEECTEDTQEGRVSESQHHDGSMMTNTHQKHRNTAKMGAKGASKSTLSRSSSIGSTKSARFRHDNGSQHRPSSKHPLENIPEAKAQNELFWDQLISLGWLAQIGSLLSTQGNELGMLLDYAQAAVDARESLTIGFHALPQSSIRLPSLKLPTDQIDVDDVGDNSIQISGRRGQLTLSFGLDPLQFSLLPDQLKAGTSKIQVWPTLFSQGINEMQTLSNLTGKSPVQQSINEEGLRQMQNYVSQYSAWRSQSQTASTSSSESRPEGSRSRSYGPYATWRGHHDQSNASLMSNLSSDWDVVAPFKTEPWDGEPLVTELLNHLETAVLGHSDELKLQQANMTSTLGSTSSQPVHSSVGTSELFDAPEYQGGIAESASGIFGSVMEFGTSKLFSFKGSKNTSILECAEALTRALGQVKTKAEFQAKQPMSNPPDVQYHSESSRFTKTNTTECDCLLQQPSRTVVLPFLSLWATSHIVSCKSAKDRSSMSVTLSQVNLLRACHGLQTSPEQDGGDDWQSILDAMRSEVGVRIKNVERNLKLGDFAKDLLWISAFGFNEQQQSPLPLFDSTNALYQEPVNSPNALTFVRSLLPDSVHSSRPYIENAGSADTETIESSHLGESSTDFGDEGVLMEPETDESDHGYTASPQLESPARLETSPPPMRLIKSPTGPALDPVVTLNTDAGHEGNSSLESRLVESHRALSESLNSFNNEPESQGVADLEHYTSFPKPFDEQKLVTRLARSLGLDSRGRASSLDRPSSANSNYHAGTQGLDQIPSRPVNMHRSTPSWSSQQSIYSQQTSSSSPRSQQAPLFTRRLSSFGQGLRLIPKAKDPVQDVSVGAMAFPQNSHARHLSQGSLDLESPAGSSHNSDAVSKIFSGQTGMPTGFSDSSAVVAKKKKKGRFAFNKVQLKFLPDAYRPPRRMATGIFES